MAPVKAMMVVVALLPIFLQVLKVVHVRVLLLLIYDLALLQIRGVLPMFNH